MAPERYKTSNSSAKNPLDVRPWLCGRTSRGCLHVRREGVRTYDHRVSGRTCKEPLNGTERKLNESLNKKCTKDAIFVQHLNHVFLPDRVGWLTFFGCQNVILP